jgi:L-iditol 2-dehydrogenase
MRVAVYYSNRDVRIEEMTVPEIDRDEILVRVLACGICGSDVMEWYRIKTAPRVLGHEIAGEIATVGEEVTSYRKGERVFVSHHVPCNTCRYCLRGFHTVCETLHRTNFYPGGFAEYLRVPSLNVDRGVFRLPDTVSDDEGTFIEPLACVLRGLRISGFSPGLSVLVLGSGISGILNIAAVRALGAGLIVSTDVNDFRMKVADRLGADRVFSAEEDIPARLKSFNGGRLADLVIICTSAIAAFHQALNSVDRGGTVLFFAPTEPDVMLPVPVNDFWRNGITLMPTYGGAPLDILQAIELLGAGRIPVKEMITHRMGLGQTAEGFRLVANAQDSIKVIVEPQR